jgi:hypothetical protein
MPSIGLEFLRDSHRIRWYPELNKEKQIQPILMRRHLIDAGYTPGPEFASMLKRAYDYQIDTGCKAVEHLLQVAALQGST